MLSPWMLEKQVLTNPLTATTGERQEGIATLCKLKLMQLTACALQHVENLQNHQHWCLTGSSCCGKCSHRHGLTTQQRVEASPGPVGNVAASETQSSKRPVYYKRRLGTAVGHSRPASWISESPGIIQLVQKLDDRVNGVLDKKAKTRQTCLVQARVR